LIDQLTEKLAMPELDRAFAGQPAVENGIVTCHRIRGESSVFRENFLLIFPVAVVPAKIFE